MIPAHLITRIQFFNQAYATTNTILTFISHLTIFIPAYL